MRVVHIELYRDQGKKVHWSDAILASMGRSQVPEEREAITDSAMPEQPPLPADARPWRADFRAAEESAFEASLAATPAQRLAWLEQALAFAYKVGALKVDEPAIEDQRRMK